MFVKALTIGLIALFATSEANHGGLEVLTRWDNDPAKARILLPGTSEKAKSKGWKITENLLKNNYTLYTLYDNFGVYYSEDGRTIRGIRITIPCSDVVRLDSGINYDRFEGLQKYDVSGNCFYIARVFFRVAGYFPNMKIEILDKTGLYEIPNKGWELAIETPFAYKGCIPGLGELWYRVSDSETKCNEIYPWSLILEKGRVIGVTFQMFGKTTYGQFNEVLSTAQVKRMLPKPTCVSDYIEKYGLISLRVWFAGNPAKIDCRIG